MRTFKKLFIGGILLLFLSCSEDQLIVIPSDSLHFQLLNFTDRSYENATLFIGAKDLDNNFIATDSIQYSYLPSNLSPTGQYTHLDNCSISCGTDGLINGYHYFFQNDSYFVQIPFSPNNNNWNPDLSKILEINDEFLFVLRLPNGDQEEILGYDIRRTLINNPYPIISLVQILLTSTGIEGRISF